MLCVDDVQWSDEASLQFLAYLVRRLEGLPVLVVLAMRTGEPHEADDLLAELAGNESVSVLHPAPLTEQGTAALVTDRLGRGADTFVATCHRMTSGNPLLLRQLLRALADQGVPPDAAHVDTVRAVGSRAITSLVTLRLRRMPATVTTVARAVAVLGPTADLVTVADLAQHSEEDVAAALDVLARSEILLDGQPLDFVNPLVRDAIHADIPAGERALLHERHEPAAQVILKSPRPCWGAQISEVVTVPEPTRLPPADAEALRGLAGGAVHLPGDPLYDEARMPWNLQVDEHPAAVAYPAVPHEVARIVRAAAAAGLRVAPQGTGHGAPPLAGRLGDAVLLRTSAMTGLRVDAASRTARAERRRALGRRRRPGRPRRAGGACTRPAPASAWSARRSAAA